MQAPAMMPAPVAFTPVAVAPPAAKGSALKWVLIVVGVLFFMGALSVAGMYFAARRYVTMAENVTGVKAGDVVSSIRDAAARSQGSAHEAKRNGCLLLSKEEASAILELEVERVDGKPNEQESEEHCDFFVKPETVEQNLAKLKAATDAVKSDPNSEAKPNELPPGAADMIKTMHRGVIEGARNGEAPYFRFTVERENGKIACTALQLADKLGGGDLSGGTHEPLGVGDRATMGMGESTLCVVKGSASVTLDLAQVTGARAKGVALAKLMIERL